MGGRAGWWVGLVLVFAVGSCANQPIQDGGGPGVASGSPDVHPKWEACPAGAREFDGAQEALRLPRIDGSFPAVAAVRCGSNILKRPTGGSDMAATEERADDIGGLLAALRLPDEPRTNGACTADLVTVAFLALLDADGRWIRPGVPVDACGKPRIEFRNALDQTSFKRVSSKIVSEVESDPAATSGCGQSWADMVWVTGQMGADGPTALPTLAPDDAVVRACVFGVPPKERGSGKPAGEFVSGGALPAGRWAAIKRELVTTTAPAPACTTPATRFALLHPAASADIYVEGDGCRRILIDENGPSTLRTSTPTLTRLLFGR